MADENKGLVCPDCLQREFRTVRTRRENGWILRERVCLACGLKIQTREDRKGVPKPRISA